MVALLPPSSRLQSMLRESVQSVQWTYSLFWKICHQQGTLIWGDGYYNGAIKTRKTVQPMEVTAEESSLQRSQELRELYESLSTDETNQPARRPSAALSPEDLTESEWFYLMCVSFSFPSGVGLPGKAYARKQHVWLTRANEVDSKTFSRAILAKSARIQTVVCIPLLDGVVELGTTERVQEDVALVQHIKSFFTDRHHHPHPHPQPPKPALSEHSTSNPSTSSDHPSFHSLPLPAMYAAFDDEEEDDDEEEEEDEEHESDSQAETARNTRQAAANQIPLASVPPVAEPSELMQLEMSEDIRLGSPDDVSKNLDSDFHLFAMCQGVNPADQQRRADSFRAESSQRWPRLQNRIMSSATLQLPHSGQIPLEELTQEATHYSQTVSTILEKRPTLWAESSSASYDTYSTNQSAFAKWTNSSYHLLPIPIEGASQWVLKYALFSVPLLHNQFRDENLPKSRDVGGDAASSFGKGTPQDEVSANHVLAERRRREKLNERFIILRSLVPFVTKMDKASILGDTIEYVKQLRKKIQDLETRNKQMETDQRSNGQTGLDRARVDSGPGSEKRKLRIVEGSSGCAKPKSVESHTQPVATSVTSVQVSIIESDALVELQCGNKEGLLLDIMQMLRELFVEVTAVQSSLNNGVFTAQLRAKVKDKVNGKKASIMEVKRAIHQIIP